MSRPGAPDQPLRVAIVGAGPAGFYAAEQLLRQPGLVVEVDMLDRLPTPFGLVRGGVAPDHQKIKAVTAAFDKIAALPGFRFFGGVELGKHVSVDDLRRHYHQIFYATGAQTDRRMGIPGEDLRRSHPATEFVAWYNGHPDFRDSQFDLSQERVAVVGRGERRHRCRPDAQPHAGGAGKDRHRRLCAGGAAQEPGARGVPARTAGARPGRLHESRDQGAGRAGRRRRRGPAGGGGLDELSRAALEHAQDRATAKKVEIIQSYAARPPPAGAGA